MKAAMNGLARRGAALADARAAHRRAAVAAAADLGVEATMAGETVRLSGRGLMARWLADLSLREAGRGDI